MVDGVNNPTAVSSGTFTFTNVTAAHTISVTFASVACVSVANLTLFIEGYYDLGVSAMRSVKRNQDGISPVTDVENVTIELHSATAPYGLVATTTGVLKTTGILQASFTSVTSGSYYIAVKGRNLVQAWSALPQAISGTPLTYDFSTAASKAYGNNMKQVKPGVWAFYSGDINQDEAIDNSDSDNLFPDIENSNFGVLATDLNGDGAVDNSDTDTFFINVENSIFSNHP